MTDDTQVAIEALNILHGWAENGVSGPLSTFELKTVETIRAALKQAR